MQYTKNGQMVTLGLQWSRQQCYNITGYQRVCSEVEEIREMNTKEESIEDTVPRAAVEKYFMNILKI